MLEEFEDPGESCDSANKEKTEEAENDTAGSEVGHGPRLQLTLGHERRRRQAFDSDEVAEVLAEVLALAEGDFASFSEALQTCFIPYQTVLVFRPVGATLDFRDVMHV